MTADERSVADGSSPDAEAVRASSPDYVQSLARGLAVIRAFDADNPRQTLSEVARNTGLTRATARRFLLTLVELGYLDTDGPTFQLHPPSPRPGLQLSQLGVAAGCRAAPPQAAE